MVATIKSRKDKEFARKVRTPKAGNQGPAEARKPEPDKAPPKTCLVTDPPPELEEAFVGLNRLVDEVRAHLSRLPTIKMFWGHLENFNLPKWFEWEPSVRAAVEAGFRKRTQDPEFVKPLVCHALVADRASGVPRMALIVTMAAAYHALATVGGRAAFVMWAERNGAPRYAAEELGAPESAGTDGSELTPDGHVQED